MTKLKYRKYKGKRLTTDQKISEVTASIMETMNNGNVPWKKPWNENWARALSPSAQHNPWTKTYYSGMNPFILSATMDRYGYTDPRWGTYKNIQENGGRLDGAKSTAITYWEKKSIPDPDSDDPDNTRAKFRTWLDVRVHRVFNVQQATGLDLPPLDIEKIVPLKTTKECEQIAMDYLAREQIRLTHKGSRAAYSPSIDAITMPPKDARVWSDANEYYSTLYHECAHEMKQAVFFGDIHYAAEELVAELTSSYLCADAGIDNTLDNSAAYLSHWLGKLKDDPKLFTRAATKAAAAAKFILNR
jgi:antirestriction protein ArdC